MPREKTPATNDEKRADELTPTGGENDELTPTGGEPTGGEEVTPVPERIATYEVTFFANDPDKRNGKARMGDPQVRTGTLAEVLGFYSDDVHAGAVHGNDAVNSVTRIVFDLMESGRNGFFSAR